MPPKGNRLEGKTGYTEEHEDDDLSTYEKMKKGAENFFKEIGSLHPRVQEALFHTQSEPYLDDQSAKDLRADWKPKDNPITDWERTAHFRNGHAPPWLEADKTEAAASITESFNRSMGHLRIHRRQAGRLSTGRNPGTPH